MVVILDPHQHNGRSPEIPAPRVSTPAARGALRTSPGDRSVGSDRECDWQAVGTDAYRPSRCRNGQLHLGLRAGAASPLGQTPSAHDACRRDRAPHRGGRANVQNAMRAVAPRGIRTCSRKLKCNEMAGKIAAIHRGNIPRVQRTQVGRIVPVVIMASVSLQLFHRPECRLEPLQCFQYSQAIRSHVRRRPRAEKVLKLVGDVR